MITSNQSLVGWGLSLFKPGEVPQISPKWQEAGRKPQKSNLNKEVCIENKDYQQPEYLESQRQSLLHEIAILRKEIKPLNDQYTEMKQKNDELHGTTQTDASQMISSELAEMHSEYDSLKDQLAKLRRFYSVATHKRLEQDINYQREQVSYYSFETERLTNLLNSRKKELDDILSSPSSFTIAEQRKEISKLLEQRDRLTNEENALIQRHTEMIDSVFMLIKASGQIDSLKRKISALEYQHVNLKVEYRKKASDYDAQIAALQKQIEDKKNRIEKQKKKDNWRTNLGIPQKSIDEPSSIIHASTPRIARPDGQRTPVRATRGQGAVILPSLSFVPVSEETVVGKARPSTSRSPRNYFTKPSINDQNAQKIVEASRIHPQQHKTESQQPQEHDDYSEYYYEEDSYDYDEDMEEVIVNVRPADEIIIGESPQKEIIYSE